MPKRLDGLRLLGICFFSLALESCLLPGHFRGSVVPIAKTLDGSFGQDSGFRHAVLEPPTGAKFSCSEPHEHLCAFRKPQVATQRPKRVRFQNVGNFPAGGKAAVPLPGSRRDLGFDRLSVEKRMAAFCSSGQEKRRNRPPSLPLFGAFQSRLLKNRRPKTIAKHRQWPGCLSVHANYGVPKNSDKQVQPNNACTILFRVIGFWSSTTSE